MEPGRVTIGVWESRVKDHRDPQPIQESKSGRHVETQREKKEQERAGCKCRILKENRLELSIVE